MISPLSMSEWQSFDALHPPPTFYARPAWALALAAAFPHLRPSPVWIDCDGTRVLIPLMQNSGSRLRWREFIGMPRRTYTCALREDGTLATAEEFEAAIAALGHYCDALTISPWPLGPQPAVPTWRRTAHETSVIDLSNGVEEALRNVAGVARRMAGQAARRGVECAPLRSGLAVTTYYDMLREASERWGLATPPFSKELLEALVAYGGDNVEIWFAQRDAHPIAGGVVFYGTEELLFFSAAMRQSFAQFRPSNALNFALIQAAAERNVRWYNLGASEGLPGVERFKRGLGARGVPYADLHYQSLPFHAYTSLRSSIQRLRVPATQAQGGG
jgi:CelD/BcsL family acetyltransferase involved in cellulose biosynthesis